MKTENKIARAIDDELAGLRVSDSLRQRILMTPDQGTKMIPFPEKVGKTPARRPRMSVLIAVCAAAMLLAATAVAAAGRWGVFDFLTNTSEPIQPDEYAERIVRENLGEARNGDFVLILREVLFDGKGLYYAADLEPAREGTWLCSDKADYSREELTRPGRIDLPHPFAEMRCAGYDEHSVDVKPSENGLTFYGQGWIEDDFAESAQGTVTFGDLTIPFDVSAGPAETVRLLPQEDNEFVEILDVTLTHTAIADYLTTVYRAKARDGERGFSIDPKATYYTVDGARFFHAYSQCSGMKNARAVTGEAIMGTDQQPCPVCLKTEAQASDYWNFNLLDETGTPLNGIGGGSLPMEDGETWTGTEIIQRVDPREAYVLRVKNWGETACDIPCLARPADQD